jgi:hypothetical protein
MHFRITNRVLLRILLCGQKLALTLEYQFYCRAYIATEDKTLACCELDEKFLCATSCLLTQVAMYGQQMSISLVFLFSVFLWGLLGWTHASTLHMEHLQPSQLQWRITFNKIGSIFSLFRYFSVLVSPIKLLQHSGTFLCTWCTGDHPAAWFKIVTRTNVGAPASCSAGPGFLSLPGTAYPDLRIFVIFLCPSRRMLGQFPK